MKLGWLNPRIASKNLGDQIIEDAVRRQLERLTDGQPVEIVELPTQRFLSRAERSRARECDLFVVGGTNLLNGNIPRYLQWKLDPETFAIFRNRVVLMGVGWWQYQNVNRLSRAIWTALLRGSVHSLRDGYTTDRIASFGLEGINTGCPTMWDLPDVIAFKKKSDAVLTTITDYHREPVRDRLMLESLARNYEHIFVWPQGSKDSEYLSALGVDVELIAPTLESFDGILRKEVDYLGTRLHAGIRALQFGVRSTIVAIDNRAAEISRDTGLNVLANTFAASEIDATTEMDSLKLTLPQEEVRRWSRATRGLMGT